MKWNDFQENISSGFKELRSDKEFTDVTLAFEDGQQIEAHKVVLATSSPLFRTLLKFKSHQHLLIYMRGMKFEDLVAIIDFLYCGEANVYQENLDAFLALAEELKLKGFTGEGEKGHNGVNGNVSPPKKNGCQEKVWVRSTHPTKQEHPVTTEPNVPFERKHELERTGSLETSESDQLDEQISSMMESTKKKLTRRNGKRTKAFICKVCGREGEHTAIRRHIEAHHITDISHSCDICGKTSRSRHGLRQHIERDHKK